MLGTIDYDSIRIPEGLRYFVSPNDDNVLLFNPDLGAFVTISKDEFSDFHSVAHAHDRNEAARYIKYHSLLGCLSKLIIRRVIYYGAFNPLISSEIPSFPKVVYLETTKGCSLRCVYCYMDAGTAVGGELSSEEVLSLIDEIVELGVSKLVFTGGEPLMRRDLWEFVARARKRSLQTGIITNATLIRNINIARRMRDFDIVTVSLDGATPEVNDSHRGSGSFKYIVRGIKLLNEAGVKPCINTVVSELNVATISRLTAFVKNEVKVKGHRIVIVSKMGRGEGMEQVSDPWELYMELHNGLVTLVADLPFEVLIPGLRSRGMLPSRNCGMGSGEIFIDATGNVYPCRLMVSNDCLGGNVRYKKLKEILDDEPINSLRNFDVSSIKNCNSCFIRWLCGGGCRGFHMSTSAGDWRKNDDAFCRVLKHRMITLLWLLEGHQNAISTAQAYTPLFF